MDATEWFWFLLLLGVLTPVMWWADPMRHVRKHGQKWPPDTPGDILTFGELADRTIWHPRCTGLSLDLQEDDIWEAVVEIDGCGYVGWAKDPDDALIAAEEKWKQHERELAGYTV